MLAIVSPLPVLVFLSLPTIIIVGNDKDANTGSGDTIANTALDLSGIGSFTANYGPTGIIGIGAGIAGTGSNSPFAKITLATSNTLTAGQLNIGLNNGGGNTSKTTVLLGQSNVLNLDNLTIGAGKTQPTPFSETTPNPTAIMQFNPVLTGPNSVKLRGSAGGTSRLGTLTITNGDLYTGSSATNESGIIDFTGGTVDALVDKLVVGVGKQWEHSRIVWCVHLRRRHGGCEQRAVGS